MIYNQKKWYTIKKNGIPSFITRLTSPNLFHTNSVIINQSNYHLINQILKLHYLKLKIIIIFYFILNLYFINQIIILKIKRKTSEFLNYLCL